MSEAIITQSAEWVAKQVERAISKSLSELRGLRAGHETKTRSCSQSGLRAAIVTCTVALITACGLV
jgi:hypothetical protein